MEEFIHPSWLPRAVKLCGEPADSRPSGVECEAVRPFSPSPSLCLWGSTSQRDTTQSRARNTLIIPLQSWRCWMTGLWKMYVCMHPSAAHSPYIEADPFPKDCLHEYRGCGSGDGLPRVVSLAGSFCLLPRQGLPEGRTLVHQCTLRRCWRRICSTPVS